MIQVKYDNGFPLFTKSDKPLKFNNNKILIADIWSFWDYVIKATSKNNNRKNILSSLLEQAKMFYKAAETSELRSKPLLYYYSFLNFAKIAIEISGDEITKVQRFDHGIEVEETSKFTFDNANVQIKKLNSGEINPKKRSVCYEFMKIVEPNIPHSFPPPLSLNIKKLLMHCIGIHRTYANVYSVDECFFKLISPCLQRDGKELIFKSEIDVEKKRYSTLQQRYASNISQEIQIIVDLGKEKEVKKPIFMHKITMPNYNVTQSQYYELSKQLREKGLWYYLGKDGYTIYLSSSEHYRHSPEFIIYCAIFYLGSITRYHPYLFDDILSEEDQWIVSEFLNTQPKQFLYLVTSKILGIEIREPYSKF